MTIRSSLAWISLWLPPTDPRDFTEFSLYWQGARDTAGRNGYHLDNFAPDARGSLASLQRVLEARGTRGLLLSAPKRLPVAAPPDRLVTLLRASFRPCPAADSPSRGDQPCGSSEKEF